MNFKDLHRAFMERVYRDLGYPPRDEGQFEKKFVVPFAETALLYPVALGQARQTKFMRADFRVSKKCQQLLAELSIMSGGPPVPLVLRLLRARHKNEISDTDLFGLRDVQSFLVRTMLAGTQTFPPAFQFYASQQQHGHSLLLLVRFNHPFARPTGRPTTRYSRTSRGRNFTATEAPQWSEFARN